jgi:hypothetical protein
MFLLVIYIVGFCTTTNALQISSKSIQWSVVAEWLGRQTLNQRVVGSNPGAVSVSRIP